MDAKILTDITLAYGSMENPDWSFVSVRERARMHQGLVEEIRGVCSVTETTDTNEDVSRALFLPDSSIALTMRLSFVGDYACVHLADGRFLSESALQATADKCEILPVVQRHGLTLLNEQQLREALMFGGEPTFLYSILFSSDGLIG